jgi:hypothetical protein
MKYVSLVQNSVDTLRRDYIREHSKFIHSSYLLLEDLDKEVEMYGKKYTIAGLWDIIGYSKIILLKSLTGGYAYTDSKEVAEALGYKKFRNFVTGKEITYDISAVYKYNQMMNKSLVDAMEPAVMEKEVDTDDEISTDHIKPREDEDTVTQERDHEYVPEDEDNNNEFVEEEVDPLVKALRGSDDDSGWIDEGQDA